MLAAPTFASLILVVATNLLSLLEEVKILSHLPSVRMRLQSWLRVDFSSKPNLPSEATRSKLK